VATEGVAAKGMAAKDSDGRAFSSDEKGNGKKQWKKAIKKR